MCIECLLCKREGLSSDPAELWKESWEPSVIPALVVETGGPQRLDGHTASPNWFSERLYLIKNKVEIHRVHLTLTLGSHNTYGHTYKPINVLTHIDHTGAVSSVCLLLLSFGYQTFIFLKCVCVCLGFKFSLNLELTNLK